MLKYGGSAVLTKMDGEHCQDWPAHFRIYALRNSRLSRLSQDSTTILTRDVEAARAVDPKVISIEKLQL